MSRDVGALTGQAIAIQRMLVNAFPEPAQREVLVAAKTLIIDGRRSTLALLLP
ncbi:hypothetical protein [Rhodanobacter sp. L36]|uniref:hypothetical protein n=1 Tax=Rhodanobacter sp. L36 TaxID=1747221 RepID=UPI00131CC4D9|nr:hypothetical protein [Rhodanobacter sp. L36]